MTLVQNNDASSETPPPRPSIPSGFDWNALRRKVTPWCRRVLCRRRVVWFALGLAAVAATALGELSQLLADIASEGEVSYSAAVFTSFTFAPFEAGHELADAVRLWCPSDGSHCWLGYLDLYVWINVVVLAPSLAYLLYRVMLEVGLSRIESGWTVAVLLFLNLAEKVLTFALVHLSADDSWYALPRFVSLFKWIGIAGALAITIGGWSSKKIPGSSSLQRERGQDAEQAGSHFRTATTLAGPIIVLALFLTLVALPAGGPLDQLPDVVRNELSELFEQHNPEPLVGSVIGLLLFFLALLVATTWTTYIPNCRSEERKAAPSTWRIIVITVVVGLVILAVELILGGPSLWVGFVPFGLVIVLVLVDFAVRRTVDRRAQASYDDDPKTAVEPKTTDKTMRLASSWAPILPALAVMGSGIGLLRATFKPLVLGIHPELPWIFGFGVAFVVTVFAGAFTEWICRRMLKINKRQNNPSLRGLQVCAVVLIVGVAATLAVQPDWAKWLTSGGTVAVCLGLVALVVGALHNVSQRREPWAVTARLGLGRVRTPCVGIIAITWLVAVVVNGSGGYHDIDVYQDGRDATYASPSAAVEAWLRQAVDQPGRCVDPIVSPPGTAQSVIKMIMVAAPGGGIRAAYWTASGLDAMTKSTACGARNIFAVSGVSGGSIGTAAWLASPEGTAGDTVKALATDDALAASTASLFLRDLPQPFSGGSTRWRDRTEVMQDVMTSEARAFGTVEEPVLFSSSPAPAGWRPAVVFNGSSVSDGCRVLVTNVAQLPAGPSPCEPTAGKGAIPGSLDAMAGADENLGRDGTTCNVAPRGDVPLLTAALLSARFPVISPVGIFDRCAGPSGATGRVNTTYDLDGGYYENSGLLSLLQFWDAVRPTIERCNEQAATPSPEPAAGTQASACPNAAAHIQIQPWIVVLDNNYESSASAPPAPRQDELSLPLQGLMNSSDIVGQANLEETARVAMRTFQLAPGGGGDTGGMFARIGPSIRPTVEAPLGWVLSQTARCGLDEQLQTSKPIPVLNPGLVHLSTDCPGPVKTQGG